MPESEGGKVIEFPSHRRKLTRNWSLRNWSPRIWSRQGGSRQGGSRRRLAPVAIAASVLIFAGVGGTALVQELDGRNVDAGAAYSESRADKASSGQRELSGKAPSATRPNATPFAPNAGGGDGAPGRSSAQGGAGKTPLIVASGTNYDSGNIAQLAVATRGGAKVAASDGKSDQSTPQPGTTTGAAVPPELSRLTDPDALSGCLTAIRSEHAQPGASVSLVDLARYEGSPAVVVLLADPAGTEWVWVARPECGSAGAAHTLLHTRAS